MTRTVTEAMVQHEMDAWVKSHHPEIRVHGYASERFVYLMWNDTDPSTPAADTYFLVMEVPIDHDLHLDAAKLIEDILGVSSVQYHSMYGHQSIEHNVYLFIVQFDEAPDEERVNLTKRRLEQLSFVNLCLPA